MPSERPSQGTIDIMRENIDRIHKEAEALGIKLPSQEPVASAAPNYVIPPSLGPFRAHNGQTDLATIGKTTPMAMSEAVNGPEIAAVNREFFLKNNSPNQQAPFPLIHPKGPAAQLDEPVHILRGHEGFNMPNAYGVADIHNRFAVWPESLEGKRTTPYHEAIGHLGNDYAGAGYVPEGIGLMGPDFSVLENAHWKQRSIGKKLYFEGLKDGIEPGLIDNIDDARERLWARMANDPGGHEAKALFAEALGDMQGIHGPARTNKDRSELFKMLIGERPLPYLEEAPEYNYGPRAGQPAENFNDLQRGVHTLHKTLPDKPARQQALELWMKLFSDNSEMPEAPYA